MQGRTLSSGASFVMVRHFKRFQVPLWSPAVLDARPLTFELAQQTLLKQSKAYHEMALEDARDLDQMTTKRSLRQETKIRTQRALFIGMLDEREATGVCGYAAEPCAFLDYINVLHCTCSPDELQAISQDRTSWPAPTQMVIHRSRQRQPSSASPPNYATTSTIKS